MVEKRLQGKTCVRKAKYVYDKLETQILLNAKHKMLN